MSGRFGWRQTIVFLITFGIFLFLCLYTLNLGMRGKRITRRAAPNAAATARADIVDRNGGILAKTTYSFDLSANALQIKDMDKVANFIHSVFPDMSAAQILNKLEKTESGRGDIKLGENIGKEKAAKIRAERIEGLIVKSNPTREYPMHNSISHIVGYVNKDGIGVDGVERMANERLAAGGHPLVLSIDSRIQSVVWTELSAAIKEYEAKAAMGILMNARTGEILAAVSLPDFDPENIGAYKKDSWRFRILRDNYEMGSIFKIFNTALALIHGIPITKTFNILDPFPVGGGKIDEARGFAPPAKNLNVAQIMQYSSNRGSAQIALALPDGAQIDFFRALKFGSKIETNFGATDVKALPTSHTPTDRSRWAFGQGISTTPLHALLAANAIVNDGKYIMPTIYRRDFIPQTEQIAPREVSGQIRKIMLKVMDTSGRAAAMMIRNMNIGGKTSTAQKWIDGKYSDTRNLAAFFATFPIEAPKWSMLVIFDEPMKHPRTAAYNAVPAAGRILDAIIPLL